MAAFEVIALDTATPQLRAPGASDTYTFPRAVELPLGTANGVLYLNGSKVVTSGSALTFDGSAFWVAASSVSSDSLNVNGFRFGSGTFKQQFSGGFDFQQYYTAAGQAAPQASIFADTAAWGVKITGSEQMRLTSTGLGIGTSSPGSPLQIDSATAPTSGSILRIDNTATTTYSAGGYVGGQIRINFTNATGRYAGINFSNTGATSQEFFGVVQNSSGYGEFVWQGFNGSYAERMRLDSSGNLGLGVTPSAWGSTWKASQIGIGGSMFGRTNDNNRVGLTANAYHDGSVYRYIGTGPATIYDQDDAQHFWFTAPSGTAGNAISFTQAMTLDASGNLAIGATSAAQALHVARGSGVSAFSTFRANGAVSGALFGQDASNNAYCWNESNAPVLFGTNNTERARIDSSGNLLVGTTSGGYPTSGRGTIHIGGASSALSSFGVGGVNIGYIAATSSVLAFEAESGRDVKLNAIGSNTVQFWTANTERARITSGGNVCINTLSELIDSGRKLSVVGGSVAGSFKVASVSEIPVEMWNAATSGDNLFSQFGTEASFTQRGSIDYDRAGGLVRYNTTSDYRAKDIIGPLTNPGATIDALKVYEGKMKGATRSRPMLIAHEAQEHAPYAVSGVKDEVNEDGTPKFQQMDVSSLVPLLLAEIQSLRARLAAAGI